MTINRDQRIQNLFTDLERAIGEKAAAERDVKTAAKTLAHADHVLFKASVAEDTAFKEIHRFGLEVNGLLEDAP